MILKRLLIIAGAAVGLFLVVLGLSIAVTRHKIQVLNTLNQYAYNEIQGRVNQHELQAELTKEQYGIPYSIVIDHFAGYE